MIALPKRSRPNINADINIVPYIDVMLVLLVIFMMTTPIIEQGVEVNLPQAPGVVVEFDLDQARTVISIDPDGKYYINSSIDPGIIEPGETEAVSLKIIVNQVLARLELWPDSTVYVRGDLASQHDAFIQLVAALGYFSVETTLEAKTDLIWVEKLGIMVENVNY